MAYDRNLRLRAIKYTEEGHTLAQAAAVFKVNIGTLIGWRKRYRATGDVKMKIRCPVNKKIIPEKHDLFDNIEQGYEFSIAQIAQFRTSHFVEEHPDAYLKEIAEVFGWHPASVLKRLRKLRLREKKEYLLQRTRPETSRGVFRKNQRYSQRKARIYR